MHAGNLGGGQTAVQRLLPLPQLPDNQEARAFIDRGRGLHTETARSALTVILKLVTGGLTTLVVVGSYSSCQLVSISWGQFSKLWQLTSWLQSGHRVAIISHLVGVSVSMRLYRVEDMAQTNICGPWEGTKGPWLCFKDYHVVSFDCFPLVLHFLTSESTCSLAKVLPQTKGRWRSGGEGPRGPAPFHLDLTLAHCYTRNSEAGPQFCGMLVLQKNFGKAWWRLAKAAIDDSQVCAVCKMRF